MAKSKKQPYILCYDISDPRRLSRIHRVAVDNGIALQYSVFLIEATEEQLASLVKELINEMDQKEDDIRIYPIDNPSTVITMGQTVYPEGVYLIDDKIQIDFAPYKSSG